jgi:hypothetical protein
MALEQIGAFRSMEMVPRGRCEGLKKGAALRLRRRQNTPMPGQAIRVQETMKKGPQAVRLIRVLQSRWAMEGGPLLRGSTVAYRHDCGAAWFGIDGRMFVGWPHIRILQRLGRQLSEAFGMVRFWRQTWWTGLPESKTAGGGPTKPLPDRDVREGGWGRVDPTPGMTGLCRRNAGSEQGEPTNVKAGSMRRIRPMKKRICEGESRRGRWEEWYKVIPIRRGVLGV